MRGGLSGKYSTQTDGNERGNDQSDGALPVSRVIEVLASQDPDRWLMGQRLLSRLEPADQWEALGAPGVAEQPVSKGMRQNVATACSVSLAEAEANVDRGGALGEETAFNATSAVNDWCHDLLRTHSADYYLEQGRLLGKDEDILSPEVFVPSFDKNKLGSDEQQGLDDLLVQALRDASNALKIEQVVLRLWEGHSDLFEKDWPSVQTLGRFQQNRLQRALATFVACRATQACGPLSPLTISYCSLMPGTRCEPGQSFENILQSNLSPFEISLLETMARRALLVRNQ